MIRGIGGPVAAEVLTLCDRAEVLLRDDETGDHAQVLAQRAIVLIEFGRIAESAELASRALQLAEASEDPDALLLALHARHDALAGPDDIVERLAVAERAGQLGLAGEPTALTWRSGPICGASRTTCSLGGWTRSPGTSDLSSISSTRWAG